MKPFLSASDEVPVIMVGDFNSGSHLDWTAETEALHHGYTIPWPASIAMEKDGLKDAWRTVSRCFNRSGYHRLHWKKVTLNKKTG